MAVWLEVCGKNGLIANSITVEQQTYLDILNSVALDTKKIVDSIIEMNGAPAMNAEAIANSEFSTPLWEMIAPNFFANKLGYTDHYQGLRVHLENDIIFVSGPRCVFSYYTYFTKTISNTSREYYHHYFKEILKAFKSDFIVYGCLDFDPDEADADKVMALYHWEGTSSNSINNMELRYYEQL